MANIEDFKKQMLDLGIDPNNLYNATQQNNVNAWNNNSFGVQDAYKTAMTALDWSPWLNGSADYNNALAAQVRTQNDEWFRKNAINNADEFANRFGVRPDLAHIQELFQNSVDAEYTAKRAGLAQSEAAYQQDLNDIKADTFRTLYDPNAAAATGASLGAQAANAMASAQNFEQEASQKAVQLAQSRENLVAEEAAARAQATLNAENMYNDLGLKVSQAAAEYNNPMSAFGTAKYAFDSNNRTAQATESAASTNATSNIATTKMQTAGDVFGTTANMLNQSNNSAANMASTGLQETGDLAQSSIQAQASIEAAKQGARGYGSNPEDPLAAFDTSWNFNQKQIAYAEEKAGPLLAFLKEAEATPMAKRDKAFQDKVEQAYTALRGLINTMPIDDVDKQRRRLQWGLIDPVTGNGHYTVPDPNGQRPLLTEVK